MAAMKYKIVCHMHTVELLLQFACIGKISNISYDILKSFLDIFFSSSTAADTKFCFLIAAIY